MDNALTLRGKSKKGLLEILRNVAETLRSLTKLLRSLTKLLRSLTKILRILTKIRRILAKIPGAGAMAVKPSELWDRRCMDAVGLRSVDRVLRGGCPQG